jgi:hypothetical protein
MASQGPAADVKYKVISAVGGSVLTSLIGMHRLALRCPRRRALPSRLPKDPWLRFFCLARRR